MGESKNRAQPRWLGLTAPAVGADPGPGRDCLVLPSQICLRIYGWPVWRCWPFWGLVVGSGRLHRPGVGLWPDRSDPRRSFPNVRPVSRGNRPVRRNAHYYKLMGHPELALKEMEQAHQQNPDNLQIVNLLAQNYEELGKFEAARQLYQEALTRHGSHPALANNLCFSYYREGRWQEAETCFRQTLARDPRNSAARNNLGLLYCRLGRQDEARRLWQEAEGAAAADGKTEPGPGGSGDV